VGPATGGLYWSLFAGVLGWFFYTHHRLGLTHPVPWPDESSFLWPALAFRDTGSLYARELYEVREVLWMPPGYMVLSGIIFKLTGFSLSWARWLSALYLAGAMTCVAILLRRSPARHGHALLIGVFSISPIAALAGNTARMETLVCLVAMGGLGLLFTGRHVAAIAILLLGPLVHPNAIFVLVAGLAFVAVRGWRALKPQRWELGLMLLAISSWAVYTAHVAGQWSAFLTDLEQQYVWKRAELAMGGGPWQRLTQPSVLTVSVGLTLGWAGALRFARHTLSIAAIASGLLVQVVLTTGWLYDLYGALLYLLVAILIGEVASSVAGHGHRAQKPSLRLAVVLAVSSVLAAGMFLAVTRDSFANHSAEYASVRAPSQSAGYFDAGDRALVARTLQNLEKPMTVQFLPDADSLLFHDLRGAELAITQATFHDRLADVYVFHDSVWLHPTVRNLMQARLAMWQGISAPIDAWQVLAKRAGTDRWLLYRREASEALP
jgi:hypothetical protein